MFLPKTPSKLNSDQSRSVPFFLPIKQLTQFETASALAYQSRLCEEHFAMTSHYGKLEMDERNGLLCLRKREGKQKQCDATFRILDLEGVGLYCDTPKAIHGSVLVDIIFEFIPPYSDLSFKIPIKKSVHCRYTRISNSQVKWEQPGDFCVFRDMLEGMWNREIRKLEGSLKKIPTEKKELELLCAKSLFMIEDAYTQDELQKKYRALIKTFHPDHYEGDGTEARIILDAYNLLKSELEREKSSITP